MSTTSDQAIIHQCLALTCMRWGVEQISIAGVIEKGPPELVGQSLKRVLLDRTAGGPASLEGYVLEFWQLPNEPELTFEPQATLENDLRVIARPVVIRWHGQGLVKAELWEPTLPVPGTSPAAPS